MPHLIDANCFIDAKNKYYGFDICPGYWNWLEQQNSAGTVYSIDWIYQELIRANDDLAQWAKQQKSNFFLPQNEESIDVYKQIIAWVSVAGFTPEAQARFFSGADPFLIAYALAHRFTVVTLERASPGERKNVKIPAVCQQFNVECINPYEMMRRENARFVLDPLNTAHRASPLAANSPLPVAYEDAEYEKSYAEIAWDEDAFDDESDEDE